MLCGPPCDKLLGSFEFYQILFDFLTELSDAVGLTSVAGELSLNLGLRTGLCGGNFPCVSSVYPGPYQPVNPHRPLLLPSLNFTGLCALTLILPRSTT
jgi:hypothetical protein